MNGLVRWGILSTARINGLVIEGARNSTSVELTAVASRDPARAETYARAHGIERAYAGYEALLADPDVDAVYISLPNGLHHRWTLRALEAGKHVLCEKPYSRRPAEVADAFDDADRAGLVLSEGLMWRHHPQTRRLVDLLAEIGEPQLVRATFCVPTTDRENVRLRPELDGGSLMDVGCYCVSAARLVGGEPERVYAEQVVGPTGVDIRQSGALRFPSGLGAQIMCSFTTEHESLEVIGSESTLRLPDPWHCRRGLIFLDGREVRVEPANSYQLELENVSAASRGEAELLLGREDALGQARAIEALYLSADAGEPVRLETG